MGGCRGFGGVPAAIHLCPEAVAGGAIGQIVDGDIITLDAASGQLNVDADLSMRPTATDFAPDRWGGSWGFGRPLMRGCANRLRMLRQVAGSMSLPNGRGGLMQISDVISAGCVMPVIVIDKAQDAPALGDALLEGGMRTAEITLRTAAALDAIAAMAKSCPDLMVGAGTMMTAEQAMQVRDAGGCFAVSPGATDALIAACGAVDLPLLPGASSVSEMMQLGEKGFSLLKFFPASAAGGVDFIKALISPLPQFQFCPTGGITLADAPAWLALDNVPCLGGSWIAPRAMIYEGNFASIKQNASAAATLTKHGAK